MLLKKTVSIVFVVAFSFVAAFTVSAQSAEDAINRIVNLKNCQDSIKLFPQNLQSGFQAAYIGLTTLGQTDEFILSTFRAFHQTNFVKTHIILQGIGNERVENTNQTWSQLYAEMKAAALQAIVMLQMAMGMSGSITPVNSEIWGNRLMEWL